MVEDRKLDYIHSKRLDKPLVALEIIREWRSQDPPGRFLKADDKTGLWTDVGDKKAREKTSQALREKAPTIREQEKNQAKGSGDEEEDGDEEDDEVSVVNVFIVIFVVFLRLSVSTYRRKKLTVLRAFIWQSETKVTKSTRFAECTKTEGNGATKPVLARDHSLGREYMEAGNDMTLDGFSWQEPFQAEGRSSSRERMSSNGSMGGGHERVGSHGSMGGGDERMGSHGSMGGGPPHHYQHHQQPPSQQQSPYPPPHGYPPVRAGSSQGFPPPGPQGHYRYPSHGSAGPPPPPPPPGGYSPQISGDDRHMRYASGGRYESWGSMPSVSGGMPPPYGYPPQHAGSWSQRDPSIQREHSLGQNPLPHASVSQPARQWGPPPPHGHDRPPYPMEGPPPYDHYPSMEGPPPYHPSYPPPYGGGPERGYGGPTPSPPPPRVGGPPSPPYEVDPRVAETWSSSGAAQIGKTWSGEEYDRVRSEEKKASPRQEHREKGHREEDSSYLPKPDLVKRMTSNQNETVETKRDLVGPSVKRVALNRDNSLASNRLKEEYLAKNKKGPFNPEQEISKLRDNLEQSTLTAAPSSISRPMPLSQEERSTTLDFFAMDLMVRPSPLTGSSRSTTIEALALDLDDDPILRPAFLHRNFPRWSLLLRT
jgi:hypothetical protein